MSKSSSNPRTALSSRSPSIAKITPPKNLGKQEKNVVFEYLFCQLATFRNTASLYAEIEAQYADVSSTKGDESGGVGRGTRHGSLQWLEEYNSSLNEWAQNLLKNAWVACSEKDEGKCPVLDQYADTSIKDVIYKLPSSEDLSQLVNTILFLHITTTKQYSALTRSFFAYLGSQLGGKGSDTVEGSTNQQRVHRALALDEESITWTLKNPEMAIEQAQKQAEAVKSDHAERSKILRGVGVGLGAIAGGVLIGVTGGLAAPLVGAGVTTVLGFLGVGGTVLGLLASGLAGSAVVCGALFGAYGAHSTAAMVQRHTREVRDLAIVSVERGNEGESEKREKGVGEAEVKDTLGVRLCISGWLNDKGDVTAPWTVFEGDDTFALQWEMEALEELANALMTLIQAHAIKYVKAEVLRRTVLAGLMSSLTPLALLKIGEIIDNPWMNARALGIKTGAVLGDLLAEKAFGNRPVTLVGYSLGSLVIYEALLELASRPPSETMHLVQDVYLFGTPVPANPDDWTKIRRVVAGRVINGHSNNDYVLAVLSRAADASWSVAGLEAVGVKGVENMKCSEVQGHTMWRKMIGKYLLKCEVPGAVEAEV